MADKTADMEERKNVTQLYDGLSTDKRILFKTIVEIAFALLNGMHATTTSTRINDEMTH
ncbi:MAG: hypothetical protein ACI4JQ_02035 [Ruminococcus sp.]